ncbi:MAG: hypothetical protein A2173_03375 [Planctomycetes bacterium RBG_13_44_8b]|nr:MAG: hypothetical protein A2173_03375 [Planctomycetes bacterium RBG_13_44_8b]
MTELFNNREIAIAFWTTIFFVWASSQKEIRRSFFQLVKTFVSPKIIIPFILLLTYSFLVILLLREIHIWSLPNLKETIYWFFFSGAITAFTIITDEKTEKPIRKNVRELLTITVVLEFVVNTYVFNLPIELVFVPMVTILTAVYTYASFKTQYKKVEHPSGTLLAIIGIAMITQALIRIYQDFDKFGRFDTLIDFVLPLILTISIIPATYLLMLYASYELLFLRIDFALESSIEMRRYAKKLLTLHCYFRIGKVREMLKGRANHLYRCCSKKDIRRILLTKNASQG